MFKYVPAIFTSVFTARMLMQLKPGPQLCQSTGYIDCKMKPRRLRSDVVSQSGKLKGRHARAGAFLKRIETYYHNPWHVTSSNQDEVITGHNAIPRQLCPETCYHEKDSCNYIVQSVTMSLIGLSKRMFQYSMYSLWMSSGAIPFCWVQVEEPDDSSAAKAGYSNVLESVEYVEEQMVPDIS